MKALISRSSISSLPKVLWLGDDNPREFEYETDLLARIDWRGYDPAPTAQRVPDNPIAG